MKAADPRLNDPRAWGVEVQELNRFERMTKGVERAQMSALLSLR